jgi:hypothetical protein
MTRRRCACSRRSRASRIGVACLPPPGRHGAGRPAQRARPVEVEQGDLLELAEAPLEHLRSVQRGEQNAGRPALVDELEEGVDEGSRVEDDASRKP